MVLIATEKIPKIDMVKLDYLKRRLKEENVTDPSREKVEEILGVGYSQAYVYRKTLRNGDGEPVKANIGEENVQPSTN